MYTITICICFIEIPIAIVERVVQYMDDRVMRLQAIEDRLNSKMVKHKKDAHMVIQIACEHELIDGIRDICAYIDGLAQDYRKQEQQKVIGKFLQDVLKGKPTPIEPTGATNGTETDDFGGRSSPIFDADNNNLCGDVSTADVIAMSENKSREFWMIKEVPTLYSEHKFSSMHMLQTNPLGRPLNKDVFQDPTNDIIDTIPKTNVRPGSPSQYISPSLEQELIKSPEMRVGTPKSRPGSPQKGQFSTDNSNNTSPNKSDSPLNNNNNNNNTERGKEQPEKFVSPLELLAKSPYLGKYSIDNIQKKKKMKQKIASAQAPKLASAKPKSRIDNLPQISIKELKTNRIIRKSKYSNDILLVPLFAEKLFTMNNKPVDSDDFSVDSSGLNIVEKELSHLTYAQRLEVMMLEIDSSNEKIIERNPKMKKKNKIDSSQSPGKNNGENNTEDLQSINNVEHKQVKEIKEMSDAEKQSLYREQEALTIASQRSEMLRINDELEYKRKEQYEAVVSDTSTKFVQRLTGGVLYAASIIEKIEKELQQRTSIVEEE